LLAVRLGHLGVDDGDEVVASDVADEGVALTDGVGGVLEAAAAEADHLVAPHEAVVVVERLEIVEVAVHESEGLPGGDAILDLLGDPEVPGKAGEGRQVAGGLGAPQHGLHASDQLRDVEGLRDVVVGAELQPSHPVLRESASGEQDDRGVAGGGMPADAMEGGQPVHAGHHDVQQDQVHRLAGRLVQGFLAVQRSIDFVPLQLQVHANDLEDVGIVVGDQNPFAHISSMALLKSSAAAAGSGAPKMEVPATKTLAPAARALGAVSVVMPPSICISTGRSFDSTHSRAAISFGSASGMNAWPPKPGSTDMITSTSQRSRNGVTARSGVAGLITSPKSSPRPRAFSAVAAGSGTASMCTVTRFAPASAKSSR